MRNYGVRQVMVLGSFGSSAGSEPGFNQEKPPDSEKVSRPTVVSSSEVRDRAGAECMAVARWMEVDRSGARGYVAPGLDGGLLHREADRRAGRSVAIGLPEEL